MYKSGCRAVFEHFITSGFVAAERDMIIDIYQWGHIQCDSIAVQKNKERPRWTVYRHIDLFEQWKCLIINEQVLLVM